MPHQDHDIVIVAAKRTPLGSFLGALAPLPAPALAAVSHAAAIAAAGINPADIDEVITGCVLPAGLGQAPARQAALHAGIPDSVGATTINKVCGSGMKAIMLAHDLLRAGSAKTVLASGMESMSNAPYLLTKARTGYRLGHGDLKDHLFLDGLEDAYDQGKLMGVFAEATAAHYHIGREAQDAFARMSMERALQAIATGAFAQEIAPVTAGADLVTQDQGPDATKLEKITRLKPAFKDNGTITAANASSLADGAASLLLMPRHVARAQGIQPLARIQAHATHSGPPQWFTTAPIEAIRQVLHKAGWHAQDVDLYEINEAFAVVALVAMQALALKPEHVNVHGGACALGHPIGASGARIVVTLLHALQQQGKQRGIATVCIGGGEATALALEIL